MAGDFLFFAVDKSLNVSSGASLGEFVDMDFEARLGHLVFSRLCLTNNVIIEDCANIGPSSPCTGKYSTNSLLIYMN